MNHRDEQSDIVLNPTGIQQHVSMERQTATLNRMDDLIEYSIRSNQHMWTAIVLYHLSDHTLQHLQDGNMSLDTENLLGTPGIGCYLCEKGFTKREMKRKCKGKP